MVKEREILIAIFNAIGAWAKRTTGATFLVCMRDQEGYKHRIYPNTSNVTWFRKTEAVANQTGGHVESHSMHFPLHGEIDATPREPRQVVGLSANCQD